MCTLQPQFQLLKRGGHYLVHPATTASGRRNACRHFTVLGKDSKFAFINHNVHKTEGFMSSFKALHKIHSTLKFTVCSHHMALGEIEST